MAEVDEPQFTTLAERIAALNQQKNFQAPPPGAGKRAPPPPPQNRPSAQLASPTSQNGGDAAPPPKSPSIPPRPTSKAGAKPVSAPPPLPRRSTAAAADEEEAPPALPSRNLAPKSSATWASTRQLSPAPSPALRRPSGQNLHGRRNSNSSDISYISTASNLSLTSGTSERRLPPTLDQAKLPPLPPTRRELEAKAKEEAAAQAARAPLLPTRSEPVVSRIADPPRPSLPPRLPSRPARSAGVEQTQEQAPALPTRRLAPPPASVNRTTKSALEFGFSSRSKGNDKPPPVPLSSRPTFAQIDAAVSNTAAAPNAARPASAPPAASCLVCRDFSAPDAVAAQHPAHSLPRHDPIGYLAHVLCDPFPSHTDKARAIFTWCHHNIAYDVDGFFGGCIPRGQSTAETVFSGKAVCEGYAKVYEDIAKRAGLGCVLVGGHGKGYGFTPLAPGQPPPRRDPSGHAWNAVRIDGGEWKLLDACWGAGSVGERRYTKRFAPEMFYLSNEIFGLKHFPSDSRHFYRADGSIPSWEEYIVGPLKGEQATWYTNATQEGLNEFTFTPREKNIPVYSGEVVRFQFSKLCEHWDPERNGKGKPYLFMMKIHGLDGRKEDLVPLDHDGFWWWVDIPARDLGAPGQKISLYGLETLDGQPARGVTKEEFLRKKGKCGMSWVGVAAWELV